MLSFPWCIPDSLPSQVLLPDLFFSKSKYKTCTSYIDSLYRVPYSFFSYQALPVSFPALFFLFPTHYLYLFHCLRDVLLSVPIFLYCNGQSCDSSAGKGYWLSSPALWTIDSCLEACANQMRQTPDIFPVPTFLFCISKSLYDNLCPSICWCWGGAGTAWNQFAGGCTS